MTLLPCHSNSNMLIHPARDRCYWSSHPHVQGDQGQGFSLGFFVLFYFVVLIALSSLKVVVENPRQLLDAVLEDHEKNVLANHLEETLNQLDDKSCDEPLHSRLESVRERHDAAALASIYRATHRAPPLQLLLDRLSLYGTVVMCFMGVFLVFVIQTSQLQANDTCGGENVGGKLLGFTEEDTVFMVTALVFGFQPLVLLLCNMMIEAKWMPLWVAGFRYRLAYFTLYMLAVLIFLLNVSMKIRYIPTRADPNPKNPPWGVVAVVPCALVYFVSVGMIWPQLVRYLPLGSRYCSLARLCWCCTPLSITTTALGAADLDGDGGAPESIKCACICGRPSNAGKFMEILEESDKSAANEEHGVKMEAKLGQLRTEEEAATVGCYTGVFSIFGMVLGSVVGALVGASVATSAAPTKELQASANSDVGFMIGVLLGGSFGAGVSSSFGEYYATFHVVPKKRTRVVTVIQPTTQMPEVEVEPAVEPALADGP